MSRPDPEPRFVDEYHVIAGYDEELEICHSPERAQLEAEAWAREYPEKQIRVQLWELKIHHYRGSYDYPEDNELIEKKLINEWEIENVHA